MGNYFCLSHSCDYSTGSRFWSLDGLLVMLLVDLPFSVTARHVEIHHYSHCMPKGRNICYGWQEGDLLVAVAVYGNGVNPYQASFLAKHTQLPVTNQNLVEAKRFARTPDMQAPMTQFLAATQKHLRMKHGIRYIVSFSDPDVGHTGGLYRAANYVFLGKTQEEWHLVDSQGVPHHRRYPYRYAKRHNISTSEARDQLNLTRVKTGAKTRWFLPLHPKDRKKLLSVYETFPSL